MPGSLVAGEGGASDLRHVGGWYGGCQQYLARWWLVCGVPVMPWALVAVRGVPAMPGTLVAVRGAELLSKMCHTPRADAELFGWRVQAARWLLHLRRCPPRCETRRGLGLPPTPKTDFLPFVRAQGFVIVGSLTWGRSLASVCSSGVEEGSVPRRARTCTRVPRGGPPAWGGQAAPLSPAVPGSRRG